MTNPNLREILISKGWVDNFNADTLIRLIESYCDTPAPVPVAEAFESAGVFKGAHGLAGLLNADDFWEQMQYGTRLYYGQGIADYLHRDVLRAAVRGMEALPAPAEPTGTTTMTAPLSPTAQAVLDASMLSSGSPPPQRHRESIAAALRATARHCVPDDSEGHWVYIPHVLAIATELETNL